MNVPLFASSRHTINCLGLQLSSIRSILPTQPAKIFRNSLLKYSNASNRTTFRMKPTPVNIGSGNGELPNRMSNLWRPIGFTISFAAGTFAGVSIWQYENIYSPNKFNSEWFQNRFSHQRNDIKGTIKQYWNKLSSGEKVFVPILAINLLVFGLWRVQSIQPFMLRYFCSNPVAIAYLVQFDYTSKVPSTTLCHVSPNFENFQTLLSRLGLALSLCWLLWFESINPHKEIIFNAAIQLIEAVCWPMLLSTFSHYSTFHIFANMYVLHSFANVAVSTLGREQFLYLYLCGGVISTLGSYVFKTALATPGLSIGASGAIMAILTFVCVQYPDTKLGIIFLPMLTFSAGAAIKVLVGIDLAGCILGWKFFDHAAHLGGAVTGLFWYFVGINHVWPKRIRIQQYWHQIRSNQR